MGYGSGREGSMAGHWDGAQVQMLNAAEGQSANNVHAIAEDREGDLWIGTEPGGLKRLPPRGKFTSFPPSADFSQRQHFLALR